MKWSDTIIRKFKAVIFLALLSRGEGEKGFLAWRVCTEVGNVVGSVAGKRPRVDLNSKGRKGGDTCARGRGAERRLIIQFQDSHYLRPLARSRSSRSFAFLSRFFPFCSPLFPLPANSWWILLIDEFFTLSAAFDFEKFRFEKVDSRSKKKTRSNCFKMFFFLFLD